MRKRGSSTFASIGGSISIVSIVLQSKATKLRRQALSEDLSDDDRMVLDLPQFPTVSNHAKMNSKHSIIN